MTIKLFTECIIQLSKQKNTEFKVKVIMKNITEFKTFVIKKVKSLGALIHIFILIIMSYIFIIYISTEFFEKNMFNLFILYVSVYYLFLSFSHYIRLRKQLFALAYTQTSCTLYLY